MYRPRSRREDQAKQKAEREREMAWALWDVVDTKKGGMEISRPNGNYSPSTLASATPLSLLPARDQKSADLSARDSRAHANMLSATRQKEGPMRSGVCVLQSCYPVKRLSLV